MGITVQTGHTPGLPEIDQHQFAFKIGYVDAGFAVFNSYKTGVFDGSSVVGIAGYFTPAFAHVDEHDGEECDDGDDGQYFDYGFPPPPPKPHPPPPPPPHPPTPK